MSLLLLLLLVPVLIRGYWEDCSRPSFPHSSLFFITFLGKMSSINSPEMEDIDKQILPSMKASPMQIAGAAQL
jgi:hypothetical protein